MVENYVYAGIFICKSCIGKYAPIRDLCVKNICNQRFCKGKLIYV